MTSIGSVKSNGLRTVYFNLNGLSQKVEVHDLSAKTTVDIRPLADRQNDNHIAAQMPGTVFAVKVKEGDQVEAGQLLIITEAMKMETSIVATKAGVVKKLYIQEKDSIKAGELLIELG